MACFGVQFVSGHFCYNFGERAILQKYGHSTGDGGLTPYMNHSHPRVENLGLCRHQAQQGIFSQDDQAFSVKTISHFPILSSNARQIGQGQANCTICLGRRVASPPTSYKSLSDPWGHSHECPRNRECPRECPTGYSGAVLRSVQKVSPECLGHLLD